MMSQIVSFMMSRFNRKLLSASVLLCLCQSISWAQNNPTDSGKPSTAIPPLETEKPSESASVPKTESAKETNGNENQSLTGNSDLSSELPSFSQQKASNMANTPPALEPSTSTVTPGQIQPVDLSPEALHQEMNLLKQLLKTESGGETQNETVIVGEALKAPSRYHQYLEKAADISQELLNVREELLTDGGKMSLQQLGALAQDFSLQYDNFRKQLTPSEQKFQSAMLIETAVKSLNEAIDYWCTSNHYRRWGHGSYTDKIDDNQILQLKLQTANTAIGNLSGIVKTRQLFSRSFDIDSN